MSHRYNAVAYLRYEFEVIALKLKTNRQSLPVLDRIENVHVPRSLLTLLRLRSFCRRILQLDHLPASEFSVEDFVLHFHEAKIRVE